ncbi:excisionase family DNA binding protein [Chelatococcus caeni]|uniref:Excisionase family DNA binding protein n=1 Tax=Chelatococcus caeni TaxID=1348468 RepID=A0A840C277_9HYPH|nr:helix-turn-helix domain-containing protein [Chelatococcus caeni]MBB4017056.1 excisionase family DNA binding protein [Chelatococcus caeni]
MAEDHTSKDAPRRPRALTIDDACRELSVSRNSIYRAVERGQLTMIKVCGRSLITAASIDRLLGEGGEE